MDWFARSARVILFVIGVVGALFAPPYVPLVVILLLSLRYRAAEAMLIGLVMDMVWRPELSIFHAFPLYTFASIVIVWVLEPLRAQLLH